jgi:hypothetical protein
MLPRLNGTEEVVHRVALKDAAFPQNLLKISGAIIGAFEPARLAYYLPDRKLITNTEKLQI